MKKTTRSILAAVFATALLLSVLAVSVCAAGSDVYTLVQKDSTGTTIVSVSSTAPELSGSALRATNVTYSYPGFDTDAGYRRVVIAYDVAVNDGVVDIASTSAAASFSIKLPATLDDASGAEIYYIGENGAAKVSSEVKDGYISFSGTALGVYAISVPGTAPVPYVAPDYTWLVVLIIVILAALAAFGVYLLIKRAIKKLRGDEGETAPIANAAAPVVEAAPAVDEAPVVEEAAEVEVVAAEEEEAPAVEEAAEVEVVAAEEAEAPAVEEAAEVEVVAAEEAPIVEEAPVVESAPEIAPEPAPEAKPVILLNFVDDEAESAVAAEAVSVRFRTSFESRYIQSGNLQDYYTPIKNALLSYKGVKARTSWNYEAFNKGRVQCAKINIKGNALLVYLNLNPADFSIKKYHFNDLTDKPKFADVPMLMKVKSDRALKYTLELIAEMMKTLEIPAGEAQNVDYHLPYETTEQLASRGLVKVIAPAGTTLGDNATVKKTDVGAMFSDSEE